MRRLACRRGLTLPEVLAATGLFLLVATGLARALAGIEQARRGSADVLQAALLAAAVLEAGATAPLAGDLAREAARFEVERRVAPYRDAAGLLRVAVTVRPRNAHSPRVHLETLVSASGPVPPAETGP